MPTPPGGRCCGRDIGAGYGIVERRVILQRAGHRARGERMVNGIGAREGLTIADTIALPIQIAAEVVIDRGMAVAEAAAAGSARECGLSVDAAGGSAADMPSASGEMRCAAMDASKMSRTAMEAADTCAAKMAAAACSTKVCNTSVEATETRPTTAEMRAAAAKVRAAAGKVRAAATGKVRATAEATRVEAATTTVKTSSATAAVEATATTTAVEASATTTAPWRGIDEGRHRNR